MADKLKEAKEAALAEAYTKWYAQNDRSYPYSSGFESGFDAGHAHATANHAAEIERLRAALRAIRDMPEYDQDDCHRLRNEAGVALGKLETPEGGSELND